MTRLFIRIACLFIMASSACSCIFSNYNIERLKGNYYHNSLEPYYRIEYKLNGELQEYVCNTSGMKTGFYTVNIDRSDTLFHFIASSRRLRFNVDKHGAFKVNHPYAIQSMTMVNRYGHMCQLTGEWRALFKKGGEKSYDLCRVTFEGDMQDPDTGEILQVREGCVTLCKNAMPYEWKRLSKYLR